MEAKLYAVFDVKAQVFMSPVAFGTNGLALRWFADLVNNPECPFSRHPGDYILYEVGGWNDQSGNCACVSPHVQLAAGTDFVEAKVAEK